MLYLLSYSTLRCWRELHPRPSDSCTPNRQSVQKQQHPTKVWAEFSSLWSNRQEPGRDSNSLVANVLRTGSRVYFKRPTKFWSETYGALPLSYSATHLGLRWWDSNPRPPAYKACTPSRQSVLFHWPGDEVVVRRIALPLSYTHHQLTGWVIGIEPTTDVLQPAVAAAKSFQRTQRREAESRHCCHSLPNPFIKERPSARRPRL